MKRSTQSDGKTPLPAYEPHRFGKDLADQGVVVFFVSMDLEEEKHPVKAFLAEQGYSEPSFLRTGKDEAFILGIHQDGAGVLPATFVYSQNGSLVVF